MNEMSRTKSEVIAFSSGKGGTGKTSITAALGYALTYSGHRVLLVDADPATDGFSLFILGPDGRSQASVFNPDSTFTGILEGFTKTGRCDARPHVIHRASESDHGISYNAIISGKSLYGDSATTGAAWSDWCPVMDRLAFQGAVRALFDELRSLPEPFDYILVDCRGGFSFESTDVVAAADSFVLVTEATYTNFYQDRNLVDRINSAAEKMETTPLLRGIIVNKAINGDEASFRRELEKEFGLRFEDTYSAALDLQATTTYKTQKIIYREAPASRFAYDTLRIFQQLLKIVTSQWPEERVRKWNELVSKVDKAIEEQNALVERAKKEAENRAEEVNSLQKQRDTLLVELATSKAANEQERQRQDLIIREIKEQQREREALIGRQLEDVRHAASTETANRERDARRRLRMLTAATVAWSFLIVATCYAWYSQYQTSTRSEAQKAILESKNKQEQLDSVNASLLAANAELARERANSNQSANDRSTLIGEWKAEVEAHQRDVSNLQAQVQRQNDEINGLRVKLSNAANEAPVAQIKAGAGTGVQAPVEVTKFVTSYERIVGTDPSGVGTGISVLKGDSILIYAISGDWGFGGSGFLSTGLFASKTYIGADGNALNVFGDKYSDVTKDKLPLPSAAPGSLIARIGPSQPVPIGSKNTILAMADGELRLGINFPRTEDWSGTITVEIIVTSASRH